MCWTIKAALQTAFSVIGKGGRSSQAKRAGYVTLRVHRLMDSQQIRKSFVEFFTARGHTHVPSASLIPSDPTILLTNAGMVPFKTYMMGLEASPWGRAVSVQKCFRAIDIDQVGRTKRHLTFFEMLENFSFGDYYKGKAIPWAYEYITEVLELDPDRLWYTVHETDDEARQVWVDKVGVPATLSNLVLLWHEVRSGRRCRPRLDIDR